MMKPLLYGYNNWVIPNSTVIHLGPFGKFDDYFPDIYTTEDAGQYPKNIGVLVASYIIGGYQFMTKRYRQLYRRFYAKIGHRQLTQKDFAIIQQMGEEERQKIASEAKFTYNDILERLSNSLLYEAGMKQIRSIKPRVRRKLSGHDNWKSRMRA